MRRIAFLTAIIVMCVCRLFAQGLQPVIYTDSVVMSTMQYKEGNKYQKDYLLFLHLLHSTHPAFSKVISFPMDFEKLRVNGYDSLKNCNNNLAFQHYIQAIVTNLHDGHTGIMLYNYVQKIFPILIKKFGDSFYLYETDESHKNVLGKEISSVNGVGIQEFLNSFHSDISYDNEIAYQQTILNTISIVPEYWIGKKFFAKDSIARVEFSDGTSSTFKTVKNPFHAWCVFHRHVSNGKDTQVRQNNGLPFSCQYFNDKGIAYLQFNECTDQYSTRLMMKYMGQNISEEQEKSISTLPNFHDFLKTFFLKAKENNVKTVVIDVRNNPGGNGMLCMELLSYLKPYSEIKGFNELMRFSPLYESFYKSEAVRSEQLAKKMNEGKIDYDALYCCNNGEKFDGANIDVYHEVDSDLMAVVNTSKDVLFKGKVVFVQNETTYSSAANLITCARDNMIGIIIGGESSYNASSYGDLIPWMLPNTKTVGYTSHKFIPRPDLGKMKETKLTPDVLVVPTWLQMSNGIDACWVWLLKHYSN